MNLFFNRTMLRTTLTAVSTGRASDLFVNRRSKELALAFSVTSVFVTSKLFATGLTQLTVFIVYLLVGVCGKKMLPRTLKRFC